MLVFCPSTLVCGNNAEPMKKNMLQANMYIFCLATMFDRFKGAELRSKIKKKKIDILA
jgi:hypothetical protein